MGLLNYDCHCQTLPKAEFRKPFSAPLMSQQPHELYAKQRDPSCEGQEKEFCSMNGVVKEIPNPHNGSARNIFKAAVEWIRSHPVLTLVLIVLLLLAVSLTVSLAAVSGRRHGENLVTTVTPLLLACPDDWVGYNSICYFPSRDRLSWDQAKARCSELGASLAVLNDKEMEFLFHFSKKNDYWLGLHRQDQRLQWVDGSNFNSSVPVLGNAPCVHLAENYLGRQPCSTDMQYICSKAQTCL